MGERSCPPLTLSSSDQTLLMGLQIRPLPLIYLEVRKLHTVDTEYALIYSQGIRPPISKGQPMTAVYVDLNNSKQWCSCVRMRTFYMYIYTLLAILTKCFSS